MAKVKLSSDPVKIVTTVKLAVVVNDGVNDAYEHDKVYTVELQRLFNAKYALYKCRNAHFHDHKTGYMVFDTKEKAFEVFKTCNLTIDKITI